MKIVDTSRIDYEHMKTSKISFRKNTKARNIYHYTSIGGLEGILKYKTLRFTNIKYMNDKDEITAGFESMAKAWVLPDEAQKRFLSSLKCLSLQTFICCFSLEDDSLPMWNYYTKEVNNQGYNIEFDDKTLVESVLRNNPSLDGCEFAFGIVDYSKDNDSEYSQVITKDILNSMELSISKLFLAVAKNVKNSRSSNIDESLEKWEAKINDTEKKRKLSDLPIYFYDSQRCSFDKKTSANYLFFVKRDYFAQEKEFRIVVTVPNELLPKLKEEGVYKFRISNGVLIPYIELKFSEDVVKGITISPTVQSDLVEDSIKDFVNYCGYEIQVFSIFIKHSKIPVRF